MRQAIQHLVDRGLLVRKRGVGTQVVQARTAFDGKSRAVEYAAHVYRASRFSFTLTLVER